MFLCLLFFKFSTHYSIFSFDCLIYSYSPDEVFFTIGNIKTQIIFLFLNTAFHTHQTYASLFALYVQSVHIALRCKAPYIVIVFLDFLSTFFNSISFHFCIPVSYSCSVATAHAFTTAFLFFSFSFHFRINQTPRLYSFIVCFFFHFILFDLIQFQYVYTSFLTYFITSLFGSFIPSHLTTFPLFMVKIPHFFIPNSIPVSVLKT